MPGNETEQVDSISLQTVFHRSEIMATILAMIRDYDAAEEVFQDTALEIERSKEKFRKGADFVPWARGIARNMVRRHYAAKARQPATVPMEALEYLADVVEKESEGLAWEAERAALRRCMDQLPERNRRIMEMKFGENLRGRAVATRLSLSEKSIRTIICRIKEELRRCIGQQVLNESE